MVDNTDNNDNNNNNTNLSTDGLDIQSVIAESQLEVTSLKKELEEMTVKLRSSEREVEKYKSEAERENKKGKTILDEKKEMLEKVKFYQEMHEGVDAEIARELLKREREGEGSNFESEKQHIMESAVNEFRETQYLPLLDDIEDLKAKVNTMKEKLHDSVVVGNITKNALKYGVEPSLASYVVKDFESRMKIDEKGDMVYLNKDGHRTNSFDWKAAFLMLKQDNPALFRKSTGSTTNPNLNVDSLKDINVNPWKKETRNASMQAKLLSTDRERANKLRVEVGLKPV